jgi:lysocardiolipin and lysophospholipid acyltransferase
MMTDWLYLWQFSYFYNCAANVIFMLKQSIRQVPMIGMGMQDYGFIFIRRRWEHDRQHVLESLGRVKDGFVLVMFPEGTTLHPDALQKSQEYAVKTGISTHPSNVLLPRSTGLWACVDQLSGRLDSIIDITIGIPGIERSEFPELKYPLLDTLFLDKPPRKVHFRVDRIPRSQIPSGKEEFDEWLMALYHRKDLMLEEFRGSGEFSGKFRQCLSGYSRWWKWLVLEWLLVAVLAIACIVYTFQLLINY